MLRPGMRVGILGGSFDPPHLGHLRVSQVAKQRFDLDLVIWMVSPGNPLKSRAPAMLRRRMEAAAALLGQAPGIRPSDFEAKNGLRYTAETVSELLRRYPMVQFMWLMGGDNLREFHKWRNWRAIIQMVPIGVVARPGQRGGALSSPMPRAFRHARLSEKHASVLCQRPAPAWCFVNMSLRHESSTAIRASGRW